MSEAGEGVLYEPLPEFVVQTGDVETFAERNQNGEWVRRRTGKVYWTFDSAHFDMTNASLRADALAMENHRARVVTREVAGI